MADHDGAAALASVCRHGIMLVSAKGPVPRLTEAIIGEAIKGSWWGHPQGRRIFAALDAVTGSDQVLVCRLIEGKLTVVHRRLWPQLVRIADRFAAQQLAQVRERHTPSGRHASTQTPFPEWVPADVLAEAASVEVAAALALFSDYIQVQP